MRLDLNITIFMKEKISFCAEETVYTAAATATAKANIVKKETPPSCLVQWFQASACDYELVWEY